MAILNWFIKVMKSEPKPKKKKRKIAWVIDESKCLSIEEVKKLKNAVNKEKVFGLKNNKFSKVRNWFMIELGLNCGLRVDEMAKLKKVNLLIDDIKSSIVLIGKGNKKRTVWINSKFKEVCRKYIAYKEMFGYSTDDDSFLLNNLKDEKISKRALQKFFKEILKKAELPDHYYIHCLRHTYTTFLLKSSNYNYRFVQKQLGHSSIRTTQVYASVIDSEGKIAVENLYQ